MMMTITMMLLIAKDKIQFSPTTQSILDHWISWRHWSTETTYTKVNLFAFVSRLGMYFAKTSESTLEKGCLFWYLCWLIQGIIRQRTPQVLAPTEVLGTATPQQFWFSNLGGSVLSSFHQTSIQIDRNIWSQNQTLSFSFANSIWTTSGVVWVSLFCIHTARQPVEAVRNHWSWVFSIDTQPRGIAATALQDESFRKVEIRIDLEKRYKGYNARNLFFGMMSV